MACLVTTYPSVQIHSPTIASYTENQQRHSQSSNYSSERTGSYAYQALPSTAATSPNLSVCSSTRGSSSSKYRSLVLDEATKSRLLQLYTTTQPITDPKEVQSHLTCLYLTRHNVNDVISGSLSNLNPETMVTSQGQLPRLSYFPTQGSYTTPLKTLLSQSWKVTLGTIDFLELIWTGHRSTRDWSEVLSSCTCSDQDETRSSSPINTTFCPLVAGEDEYLALNLAVTYYYTPDGQPTISLAAIAMTKEAFDTISDYVRTHPEANSTASPAYDAENIPHFDTVPFVHRDLLVPTLCRWRNAEVEAILNMAAEGRAWSSKLLRPRNKSIPSTTEDTMDIDTETKEDDEEVEVEGSWFFPTIKTNSSSKTSPSPSDTDTPPIYELRAALVPGRNIVFRTLASRLSRSMNPAWIRRSSQHTKHNNSSRPQSQKVGMKRRREA